MKVFKFLYWNLFDPAKIEQFGSSPDNCKAPRVLGMILFAVFLLFSVVIIMNALIAIMNSTLNEINMDKIKQWKFARTTMWLTHFDKKYVLPVPFNLLEILVDLARYIYRRCTCQNKKQTNLRKGWKTDR